MTPPQTGLTTRAALYAGAAAVAAGALSAAGAPAWAAAGGAALGAVAIAARPGRRAAPPAAPPPPERDAASLLQPGAGRALLDRLPSGLVLIDGHERVIYQNAAAEELFERRLVGMRYVSALRSPLLTDAVAAALARGRSTDADVTLRRTKQRVAHVSVRLLEAPASRDHPHVLMTLDDRTRAAKAEELRRDFVANASHELKTPLASISGFIETLQGHARGDAEAADRFLAIMAQQADRMKRLVDDLLSLNRIEINEHVRPTEELDLAVVVWEVCSALGPIAAAAGSRIEVRLPEEGLPLRGSRDELSQVFVNLIDNALKYAAEHGPIVVDRVEAPATRPGMVGVRVSDSGPGIAREHLPRLTERFYRVDVARSRERGGTGLGLAIAKHVLNRHRGDLSVASVVGQGAQFTAWFPLLKPVAAPAEEPDVAAQ